MLLFLIYFGLLFSGMELRMYASIVNTLPHNCTPNFFLLLKKKTTMANHTQTFFIFPLNQPWRPSLVHPSFCTWNSFSPMDSAKMRSSLATRLKSLMSEMSAIRKCLPVETCTPSISLHEGREFLPKPLHSPSWAPTRKNGSEFYWVPQWLCLLRSFWWSKAKS